ncbi:GntR family transcriptional regulator [Halomonas sp. DN3]|uniref:GntR family transcriptional regulator n=1 Tax=Halomonas sp. DN3 TaxID=2953657 RepID=UPI0020A18C62|nr:GntR family transcriptional regulator [Halomonas sp. DN3]USZ51107.1 GntR family transcriptional regulator [Halomonas sp. DN3]
MKEKINKTTVAYNEIEQRITFQQLKPGAMISEKVLAEELGLGRTPVREALQRLAYERMVYIHSRRGIQIAPLSVENQLKILEVRRSVEALCVRFAVMRADVEAKQKMLALATDLEKCARLGDQRAFADCLKRIHELMPEAANNDYLQLAMAPLQGLSRRFWFAHLRESVDLPKAARLHSEVLRAISHTDADAAVNASYALNDYLTEFAYATIGREA